MPKYVVSTTLTSPEWNNTTVIGTDLAKEIAALKEGGDGDILVNGSVRLARALLQQDLVDELRLMVFPIVLGGGKRLFEGGVPPKLLKLVETRQASDVAILTLRRA